MQKIFDQKSFLCQNQFDCMSYKLIAIQLKIQFNKDQRAALYFTMSDIVHKYRAYKKLWGLNPGIFLLEKSCRFLWISWLLSVSNWYFLQVIFIRVPFITSMIDFWKSVQLCQKFANHATSWKTNESSCAPREMTAAAEKKFTFKYGLCQTW